MKNIIRVFSILLAVVFIAAGCNPLTSKQSAGLIRSTSGGAEWTAANTIVGNAKASLLESNISILDFAPGKRDVLYAGSYTDGLFKSEDSGGSWTQILSRIAVYDVALHPDGQIIYVGGYVLDHGKLLKSSDGGRSWEETYSEETTQNAVRTVSINPNNSSEVVIGLTSGNFVKSLDGGKNWVFVRNFEDRINRVRWHGGYLYIVLTNKGLYKSSDSGNNWLELTSPILARSGSAQGLYLNATQGVSKFSQFAVNMGNLQEIYVTTDRGVYKTVDDGRTWSRLPIPIQNINTQARAVAISVSNPQVVYTSAGTTIYKTLDGGISFQTQGIATSGFINYILVDPTLPQIAFAGIFSQ